MTKIKLLLSFTIIALSVSQNSYAERERESNQLNSRVESPYVLNVGFSLPSGLPFITFNYNFIDKLSAGLGFGYSSAETSTGSYSVTANTFHIVANGKYYIYDFNPNFSFYTETDLGLVLGNRAIGGGTFSTPSPLSTVPRNDFLFQQKIGVEARYSKGLTVNAAWGVFYETMDTTNSPFLGGLFQNSFVPLAIDLLLGYSF